MLMNMQWGNDKDSAGDRYACIFVDTECGVDFIMHVNFLWYIFVVQETVKIKI